MLAQIFQERLDDVAGRSWDLPPIIVRPHGEYVGLLKEARELYEYGYFYSCVAMCGIVCERLVKDLLRASVIVEDGGSSKVPPDKAFDQLERVEVGALVRFLEEAGPLATSAKAAKKLGELRNKYAHARGKKPKEEALKAIGLLHEVVEDTVSVFKDYDIEDGRLVRKPGDAT